MQTLRTLFTGLLAGGMLALAGTAAAATPTSFEAGTSYVPVSPAQPTGVKPGQIEVIEFFWYGCPHCFALEPYLEAWLQHKPANVVFKRIPANFPGAEKWPIDAQAYFTAAALGLEPRIHEPLFNAIHLQNRIDLVYSQDALQKFFAGYGVNKAQFDATWNSFAVNFKMQQALQIQNNYNITGVPTLIVDGKWMTGAGYLPVSQIMACVDFLVQKEQAALKQPSRHERRKKPGSK